MKYRLQINALPGKAGLLNVGLVLSIGLAWLLLIVWVVALPVFVRAESSISSGFLSKTDLPAGVIVSQSTSPGVVTLANSSNIKNLLGVVSSSSAIALTSDTGDVQVVGAGIATAFVSDAKGDIRAGDRITVSELSGVGVKLVGDGKVLGVAQANFNASTAGAKKQNLTDTTGKKRQVAIGQIPLTVNISEYAAKPARVSLVLQPLQALVSQLLKRDVSIQAVIAGIIILVAGFMVSGFLLYGAAKGSMLSLGRNPLSRQNVLKGFGQAVLVAAGIILLSLGMAYLAILLIL